jgi:predicted nucleic acid-binding protein
LGEFNRPVLIRTFERCQREIFLSERIVDERDSERGHILLAGLHRELGQNCAGIERPAGGCVRISKVCLESGCGSARRSNGRLELAYRIVVSSHLGERHPELEVCARLTPERARQLVTDLEQVTIRELAIDLQRAVDLGLELGIYAYDAYILEAARSSGFPLLALDGPIRRNAKKLGLSLVELDL